MFFVLVQAIFLWVSLVLVSCGLFVISIDLEIPDQALCRLQPPPFFVSHLYFLCSIQTALIFGPSIKETSKIQGAVKCLRRFLVYIFRKLVLTFVESKCRQRSTDGLMVT